MKKKGFTIVEIIISINLVLIVGVTATFFILNNKRNNELEKATKEILEAANVYVKTEKDKNGNTYANEIVSGAKGVKIPLTNLVNSGYIKEELANVIYKNNIPLLDSKDYYIIFVQENEEQVDYCNENEITSYVSWMPKGENIYLCDNYDRQTTITKKNGTNLYTELEPYAYEFNLSSDDIYSYGSDDLVSYANDGPQSNYNPKKYTIEYYMHYGYTSSCLQSLSMCEGTSGFIAWINPKENGKFKRCEKNVCTNKNDYTLFYRGTNVNNYIKINIPKKNNSNFSYVYQEFVIFRILKITNEDMYLIPENIIPPDITFWEYLLDSLGKLFHDYPPCDYDNLQNIGDTEHIICDKSKSNINQYLSISDAIYAGVPPLLFDNYSTQYTGIIKSESWITKGGPIYFGDDTLFGKDTPIHIYQNKYTSYNTNYFNKKENRNIPFGTGVFNASIAKDSYSYEWWVDDFEKEAYARIVRKVYKIPLTTFEYSGSGTEENPYVLHVKPEIAALID